MLEDKDIQKMIEVFATREELKNFVTKDDLRSAVSELQTSIDAYAKKVDTLYLKFYFKQLFKKLFLFWEIGSGTRL